MVKLAVSDWRPYQHQADALEQLVTGVSFERVSLDTIAGDLISTELGPFLALITDDGQLPLLGIPSIIEMFHRQDPSLNLLPSDPLECAHSRGLAAKTEEMFARFTVADISTHAGYNRPIWLKGSEAPERMMDDLPMRLDVLDEFLNRFATPYMNGQSPGLPDCLFIAAWWVAEDLGVDDVFNARPRLAAWYNKVTGEDLFTRRNGTRS